MSTNSLTDRNGRGRPARTRRLALLGVACAAVLTCAGCIGFSGPASLARQVRAVDGVEMNRVVGFDVGGTFANLALAVASEESGIDLSAGRIDRVEVGVYELTARPGRGAWLFDDIEDEGWTPCVRIRSRSEEVKVLLRTDGEKFSGVAVLVRDGTDLVIARVRGDLGPLAEQAIELAVDEGLRQSATEGIMRHARVDADGTTTLRLTDRDSVSSSSHAM